MELLLYNAADSKEPFRVIPLDPDTNRSHFFWHVFVKGLPAGTHYTWRVDGEKELVDPWARAVTDSVWIRGSAVGAVGSAHHSIRGVVTAGGEVLPPKSPLVPDLQGAVIYELHVGGFTRHPASRVQHPGKFLGIIEKIPYLKELGITHVELLPVMAFDNQDVPPAVQVRDLRNYWGYSPHSFYSPHPHYCVTPERGTHQNEFRELVEALHAAGIGVILDVVFNHKHNEANGEDNRDGTNDNLSWNCGVEGETDDFALIALRRRQARNFIAILMISRGVPMLLAGDEIWRTQRGNNNAWCQDNELSWFDWSLVQKERDMLEFMQGMIALRRRHPSLLRNAFFTGKPMPNRDIPDIAWHGLQLNEPAWHDSTTQFLAFTIAGNRVKKESMVTNKT